MSLRDRGEARLKAQQAEVDALADLPCPTCGSKMHLLCLCYGCGNIPPNHSVLCPMNGPQVRR